MERLIILIIWVNIFNYQTVKVDVKFLTIGKDIEFNLFKNNNNILWSKNIGANLSIVKLDNECNIIPSSITEWQAAGIFIDETCKDSWLKLIIDLSNWGADFIFILYPVKIKNKKSLVKLFEKYNINKPVFYLSDESYNSYLKKIENQITTPININLKSKIDTNKKLLIEFSYLMSNINTFIIIKDLEKIYSKFNEKIKINFIPFIVNELNEKNCIYDKKYCTFNSEKTNGSVFVNDIFISSCVKEKGILYFFKFMNLYENECYDKNIDKCSESLIKKIGLEENLIKNCLNSNKICKDKNCINEKLDYFLKDSNSNEYPLININDIKYKGSFRFNDLLFSVCKNFDINISDCNQLHVKVKSSKFMIFSLITIAFTFTFLLIIMYCICKKIVYRGFKKEMNKTVKDYVDNYKSIKN